MKSSPTLDPVDPTVPVDPVDPNDSIDPNDNVWDLRERLHGRRREMQRVSDEFDDIAGHLNALHGRLVELAVWLLTHPEDWSGPGLWKPEQYLAWRCGLGGATARKIVDLARRADELPETMHAVRTGELSLDQASPIAKRVPSWAEARVVSLARRLTVRQIQRTVARYPFGEEVPDPEAAVDPGEATDDTSHEHSDEADEPSGQPAAPVGSEDRCWFGVGEDGRWRMFVETGRDRGDVIAAALDEARDAVFRRDGGDVHGLDALVELAQRSLDSIDAPARRERHRINLHLHTGGTATDERGMPLPDAIRRHLTCDGIVTPIFLDGALPVSVGRSERIVPERTRRLVLLRDGGCRVPGCTAEHHLEVHHIVHWSEHGPTDTWNLVALCPRHHRLHHQGRLGIAGDADEPDGVVFSHADGSPIRPSGASPNPPTGPPPPITGRYEHPLGERLDPAFVDFHPRRLRAEPPRRKAG